MEKESQDIGPVKSNILIFFDIKGLVEHLFSTLGLKSQLQFKQTNKYPFLDVQAEIYLNEIEVGFIGLLHKKIKKKNTT